MRNRLVAGAFSATLLALAAACSPPAPAPVDKAEAPAPAPLPAPLPDIDTAAIQATLTPDEMLDTLGFGRSGSTAVSGVVEGARAKVWAVPVAAGQTLTVTFQPSNTNLYVNVVDSADTSGAAVHLGEVDGPNASITAARDTIYLIKPYQPRATARRDESGEYTLIVGRS